MRHTLAVLLVLVAVFLSWHTPTRAAPPPNFQRTLVVGAGLNGPSGFAIAPDGRILILERTGEVRLYRDGALQSQLFANLPSVAAGDRGLIGVAFDPDYFSNHYVYFYYTGTDLLNRLVRFDASGDVGTNGPVILYETRFVSEQLHVGGGIAFGPDGKLYIGVGDNGYPPNAQDLSNPHGKILRLNKDGSVPSDNPFAGQSGALPEIWAYGFRNPWRLHFDNATGRLYAGDVGEATWEEVNLITRGGNYGQPLVEGMCPASCPYINPIYTYNHNGGSSAVTGGPVYRAGMFPGEYYGSLFFGDYARGFIKRISLGGDGMATGIYDFDLQAGSVVDMKIAQDGALYYLTYIPGALYKITYSTGNHYPVANASASTTKGVEPLTVQFSSNGSSDPDGDTLAYSWDFGDGTTSTAPNPLKTYPNKGKYTVQLRVSDGANEAPAIPIIIQVGIPPSITIGAPAQGGLYRAGEQVFYSANATDGAGFDISEASMRSEILFHHGTHIHPFLGPLHGKTGTFTIPRTGEPSADTWYEITITATDTNGLSTSKSVSIYPRVAQVILETSPPGIGVFLDGYPKTTPETIPMVVGFQREVRASAFQAWGGNGYQFEGWSDGGEATHIFTVPDSGVTLSASYRQQPAFNAQYYNNIELLGSPALTRQEAIIDFDWGNGSPGPGIATENFSVRWQKRQYFGAGRYVFTTATDDGVRLFVDGQLRINEWHGQATTVHTATLDLAAGDHDLAMEYFDSGGGAVARLGWEYATGTVPIPTPTPTPTPPPTTFTGYKGEYYANQNLGGTPTVIRDDATINFDWGGGSPDARIPDDHFSSRWTKTVQFTEGTYDFMVTADDGVRLYIDDVLVIDKWIDQGATTYTVRRAISAGNHLVRVEYYENGGGAVAKFLFEQINANPPPTPTPTPPPGNAFSGKYWNLSAPNYPPSLPTSAPALTRIDPEINFDWGGGSPDPLIAVDHFAVEWRKSVELLSGTYRFTTATDDGVRLYVDGQLLIDQWVDQGTTTYTVTTPLVSGVHEIRMEYYENGGGAVARMTYALEGQATPTPTPTPPPTGNGFLGEYWNVPGTGSSPLIPTRAPDLTRTDVDVNFVWNEFSPDPAINPDHFVARWTRTLDFAAGTYDFTIRSDDGVRFYVDDMIVVSDWVDHGLFTHTPRITLSAGPHKLRLEYYENGGGAVAILGWR